MYRAMQIDFRKFEAVSDRASAGAAEVERGIFGGWRPWPTSWPPEEPTEQEQAESYDRKRTRGPWSTSPVGTTESVDIEPRRRYIQSGADHRPYQLAPYLMMRDAHGEKREDGTGYPRQKYSPKAINGGDIGRWYSADISLQSLIREARREE